ncbi:nucleotide exchange factors-like protein [Fomitiporia mediterranea MF3/22]|uniref:nucleotide exchange factors-like protein n=1 Tax=Fomitiporia mediterranea (strain MF3/22) TaxID=694068 RepID=UPI0004407BB1|nr:nucleotide exchange factors-like protein [Fomitiporia mediterranea MF3/22]EJD05711.1 nucleotide exchange factors-like protein [Fomitiporia mediterranea MF3/22]
MQSLLRWSIENSAADASNVEQPQHTQQPRQIDPGIIDAILGRPDSVLMKEALDVATKEESGEDARLQALDDFEMLIEQIDNANNIEKMSMWPTLRDLLSSDASSDAIRAAVLWIIGTAVQNNPSAQNAYLSLSDSPLSVILSRLAPNESSSQTRSKAVYALSGLLKHNARGVKLMEESGGWKILKAALEDPDITVRRKAVFLLSSLLLPSAHSSASTSSENQPPSARVHGSSVESSDAPQQPEHPNSHAGMTAESTATSAITSAALQEHGISGDLVQSLVNPTPHGMDGDQEGDADLEEKLVRLFYTYMTSAGGRLEPNDKELLLKWLQERRGKGEHWDLQAQELDTLQDSLQP